MPIAALEQVTDPARCALDLRPGQVKRLPPGMARKLIGYYIACPACGLLNIVTALNEGQTIREGEGLLELLPGFVCTSCRRHVAVRDGRFEVADA